MNNIETALLPVLAAVFTSGVAFVTVNNICLALNLKLHLLPRIFLAFLLAKLFLV